MFKAERGERDRYWIIFAYKAKLYCLLAGFIAFWLAIVFNATKQHWIKDQDEYT